MKLKNLINVRLIALERMLRGNQTQYLFHSPFIPGTYNETEHSTGRYFLKRRKKEKEFQLNDFNFADNKIKSFSSQVYAQKRSRKYFSFDDENFDIFLFLSTNSKASTILTSHRVGNFQFPIVEVRMKNMASLDN